MSWKVFAEVRVRFADLDPLGHVNNAVFLTYFEQGRVEYFKKIKGLDFRAKPLDGMSVILADVHCSFKSPAYLDEYLIVKVRTQSLGRSSFKMEYEIREKNSDRLVATGESTMVYFDYRHQKSATIPDDLRKKFEEIEGVGLS